MESTQQMYNNLVRGSFLDGHIGPGYDKPGSHLSNDRTIAWALEFMLEGLGFNTGAINLMWQPIIQAIRENPWENEAALAVYNILERYQPGRDLDRMCQSMQERTERMVKQIGPHVQTDTLLDYGCGDGLTALGLEAIRDPQGYRYVLMYDVNDFRCDATKAQQKLRFTKDRAEIHRAAPFGGTMFGSGLLLTVLHHCEDPYEVLGFLKQVAREIVIIESIESPLLPRQTQAFIDWFWNRCLYPHANIPVPGSWHTTYEWRQMFRSLGMKIKHEEDLGLDQPTAPEHHYLWVLQTS